MEDKPSTQIPPPAYQPNGKSIDPAIDIPLFAPPEYAPESSLQRTNTAVCLAIGIAYNGGSDDECYCQTNSDCHYKFGKVLVLIVIQVASVYVIETRNYAYIALDAPFAY